METVTQRIVIGLMLSFVLAGSANAGVGDMDTSFGVDGLLRYPEGFAGLVSLPDGRLQLVAISGGELRVLRLVNGRPDPAFGTAGVLTTTIPGALPTPLNTAYVQPDGSTFLDLQGRGTSSAWLMKIDPAGRPDTNFGPNGLREIPRPGPFANDLAYIDGISLATGGAVNVLIKHFSDLYECADGMTVTRLGANGEPDTSFVIFGVQSGQVIDGCYWWGKAAFVALADNRLLLGNHGLLLDAHGGTLALPEPLQATLRNRRLLKIEDAGEYLYLIATTSAPTKPGLELNISRWRRDLTLDNTFGNSGTGYLDISLDGMPFIPIEDLVEVALLPPQLGASYMYLKAEAYGHKAGEEGAHEYASLAYRLRADGSVDRQLGSGGFRPGTSLWMSFVQQSPDGGVVADIGDGLALRLSGAEIESPGLVTAQFSCSAANVISELGGGVAIAVSRALGTQGAISLKYWTQALTATPGVDYADVQGTLSWADGESGLKTINIPIIDDALYDPDEQFQLNLERVSAGGGALICSKGLFEINSNEPYPGSSVSPSTSPPPAQPAAGTSHGGGMLDGVSCALLGLLLLMQSGSAGKSVRADIKGHRKADSPTFAVQEIQRSRQ